MSQPNQLGPSTRCVRATSAPHVPGQPLSPSPVFTSTYHALQEGQPGDFYGRNSNPTWRVLESALADLEGIDPNEGGAALVFPTGMGAITATLRALDAGTVLVPSDGYYQTRVYAQEKLSRAGADIRTAAFDEILGAVAALRDAPEPRVVVVETPTNPMLDVLDLRAVAAAAAAVGAKLIVDNTAATPFGQRPLELGADLVVAAGTKGLTGHSDLTLGYAAGRDAQLLRLLERERTLSGATVGPFEAWLAHRSLATAALRFDRQCANAQAVAELLASHPAVRMARYPGLASDPSYELAARQMTRFGSLVSFELEDLAAVRSFFSHSRLIAEATSFGGVHSTADRRARWGDSVPEGFLRLSVGIEDEADLVLDLLAALG